MATLVLGTIGTALGGPVGSAIGALIGQSIDQELLAPVRRGPRVGDLSVQTSSYGTQVPRIYGTMRVAGSVVWSTDLVEQQQTGGAKGQPDVTYSYTVSMAVALSSRQASSINRIWADGKLLRGAAGDLKVGGTLRFLDGSEDQEIDPLIGSIEGIANAPAYRGLALAIFDGLELGDFGNRIPFLTFEVEADASPVAIGALLGDASNGSIDCTATQELAGFAAYGASIKQAIEPLVDCFGVDLFDDGIALRSPTGTAALPVSTEELGNSAGTEQSPRYQREQSPARELPSMLRLTYYDSDRDYQTGEARAADGGPGGNEAQRELPAVLTAADAKALAQQMLARAWAERDRLRIHLPPEQLGLLPGAQIALPFSPTRWAVQRVSIDGFVVVGELKPFVGGVIAVSADSGRIVPNSDIISGPVSIALLDLPGLSPNSVTLLLAASSPTWPWKRVAVELSFAGQSVAVRTAGQKSMLGSTVTLLPAGDPASLDTTNSVEVQLIDEDQWLTSCDDTALNAGANLALVGDELVQFGDVASLGNGRFRLARLLRGRAGTESSVSGHAINEVFCLIATESLHSIGLPVTAIGKEVTASIQGGTSTSLTIRPRADAIPSPTGGMTIDDEARTSIDQILATLRQHGLIAS